MWIEMTTIIFAYGDIRYSTQSIVRVSWSGNGLSYHACDVVWWYLYTVPIVPVSLTSQFLWHPVPQHSKSCFGCSSDLRVMGTSTKFQRCGYPRYEIVVTTRENYKKTKEYSKWKGTLKRLELVEGGSFMAAKNVAKGCRKPSFSRLNCVVRDKF